MSVKLPLNGPLYVPIQFPERSTVAGAWVGVAVGVAVAAVDWLGVGVPPDDSPQPASTPAATTTMLATMSLVPLFMCGVLRSSQEGPADGSGESHGYSPGHGDAAASRIRSKGM